MNPSKPVMMKKIWAISKLEARQLLVPVLGAAVLSAVGLGWLHYNWVDGLDVIRARTTVFLILFFCWVMLIFESFGNGQEQKPFLCGMPLAPGGLSMVRLLLRIVVIAIAGGVLYGLVVRGPFSWTENVIFISTVMYGMIMACTSTAVTSFRNIFMALFALPVVAVSQFPAMGFYITFLPGYFELAALLQGIVLMILGVWLLWRARYLEKNLDLAAFILIAVLVAVPWLEFGAARVFWSARLAHKLNSLKTIKVEIVSERKLEQVKKMRTQSGEILLPPGQRKAEVERRQQAARKMAAELLARMDYRPQAPIPWIQFNSVYERTLNEYYQEELMKYYRAGETENFKKTWDENSFLFAHSFLYLERLAERPINQEWKTLFIRLLEERKAGKRGTERYFFFDEDFIMRSQVRRRGEADAMKFNKFHTVAVGLHLKFLIRPFVEQKFILFLERWDEAGPVSPRILEAERQSVESWCNQIIEKIKNAPVPEKDASQ